MLEACYLIPRDVQLADPVGWQQKIAAALAAARLEGAKAMQEAAAQWYENHGTGRASDGDGIRALSPEQVVG